MQITFTHKKKKNEIAVPGACEVKYYAVPKDYSDDGYYAAVWLAQDLEPVPACAGKDATLLAHLQVSLKIGEGHKTDLGDNEGQGSSSENGYAVREIFCLEGVTYAKN